MSFVVARAYLDQLGRNKGVQRTWTAQVASDLRAAEKLSGPKQQAALRQLATRLEREAQGNADPTRVGALAVAVRELANAQR